MISFSHLAEELHQFHKFKVKFSEVKQPTSFLTGYLLYMAILRQDFSLDGICVSFLIIILLCQYHITSHKYRNTFSWIMMSFYLLEQPQNKPIEKHPLKDLRSGENNYWNDHRINKWKVIYWGLSVVFRKILILPL